MILKPLPPPSEPIAGGLRPTLPFAQWCQGIDAAMRYPALPNAHTVSYQLAANDAGGIVEIDAPGANALTVPNNNTLPFPISTRIQITQAGAGTTTLTAAGGVTIRNRSGLALAGQWAVAYLYKRGVDEWVASGDLS